MSMNLKQSAPYLYLPVWAMESRRIHCHFDAPDICHEVLHHKVTAVGSNLISTINS